MVSLPPELLEEAGLAVDTRVIIRSRRGRVEIEPEAAPDSDALAFIDAFLAEYGEAMAQAGQTVTAIGPLSGQDELVEMAVAIAGNQADLDQVAEWLERHSQALEPNGLNDSPGV